MKQLFMLGLFVISTVLQAQSPEIIKITGRVLDFETGEPVPYPKLYEPGLGNQNLPEQSTFTEEGFFEIDVRQERLSLEWVVEAPGYESKTITGLENGMTIYLARDVQILQPVEISAVRAAEYSPFAKENLTEADIESQDVSRDMPYILENTPSAVTTSDAGAGIGYTGLRIRGSDQSRINVTINGVPVNDAESQGVFWVNTPDLASSVSQLQVQRGVGTSTNGAGAFGGSINMQTKSFSKEAYADVHIGGGSFGTQRYTAAFGTGLINDHWTIDARASRILSDGWIDRASSNLRSYYMSVGYQTENTTVNAVVFGGRERTYQAWYGTDSATYAADPTFNYAGAIYDNAWNVVDYYDDQVDNYGQDYYQLHVNHKLSDTWKVGVSGFLTRGAGYYQEFQQGQSFADYGLTPIYTANDTINTTDLARRLWLDNYYYGALANVNGSWDKLRLTIGGAWNRYEGDHYGTILWARYASGSLPKDQFYFNSSIKTAWNIYAKADYALTNSTSIFLDLQARNVAYEGAGTEEENFVFNFNDDLFFFNPKIGVSHRLSATENLYASYSVANREPNRKDYLNAVGGDTPRPERLQDVELGYEGREGSVSWNVNGYFMYYTDQLVLTGELDPVGYPIRENVGESYRAGVEIQAGWRISSNLALRNNLTVSQNRNVGYVENLGDTATRELGSTPIAYSPSIIENFTVEVRSGDFKLELIGRYIGKQYLANAGMESLVLPSYFVADARLTYTRNVSGLGDLRAYVMANNLLSREYASNGYVYGTSVWFYPQAPLNFFYGIELSF